jgi:hypothetical protein
MNRREAIKKSTWIAKSAIFAPALMSAIQSCERKLSETEKPLVFNDQQNALVKAIADTIIPKTDSPSASDVGVPQFLDLLLQDVFDQQVTEKFLTGLEQFDEDCKADTGKLYTQLDQSHRNDYLEQIDREVMGKEYDDLVPFYFTFKQLCVSTYYSTEQGIKQNMNYQPVPGQFQSDIALEPGDKIMVGNQM